MFEVTSRRRGVAVLGLAAALVLGLSAAPSTAADGAANEEPVATAYLIETGADLSGVVDALTPAVDETHPVEVVTTFPGPVGPVTVGVVLDAPDVSLETVLATIHDHAVQQGVKELEFDALTVVRVTGPESAVEALSVFDAPISTEARPIESQLAQPLEDAAGGQSEAALAGTCGSAFRPGTATVTSATVGTTKRRVTFNLRWSTTNLANLQACGSDTTYENDFWENNYDGTTYFGSMTSWSSNMSNDYYDTNFGDDPDEVSYTIGTSSADLLNANTSYTLIVVTTKGDASSGTAKLQAQRGSRIPFTCHSTWCIFANATTTIRAAWTISLPT